MNRCALLLILLACGTVSRSHAGSVPEEAQVKVLYEGINGAFSVGIPDPANQLKVNLSSNLVFNFKVVATGDYAVEVMPEECKLTRLESYGSRSWVAHPDIVQLASFTKERVSESEARVAVKVPLVPVREQYLTRISGTLQVAIFKGTANLASGLVKWRKGMTLTLGGMTALVENVLDYSDGRQAVVIRPHTGIDAWRKAVWKSADASSPARKPEATSEFSADGRLILTFPSSLRPGEFTATMPKRVGESTLPFGCTWPSRALFAHLGGIPVEGAPVVTDAVKIKAAAHQHLTLQRHWTTGETLRFTCESLIDTRLPSGLGGDSHVRMRNDVKLVVREASRDGGARLVVTFERVRLEEDDEGQHRETDTQDRDLERRKDNPWAAIIGHPLEAKVAADTGRVTFTGWDDFVTRVVGIEPLGRLTLGAMIKPEHIADMLDSLKPRREYNGSVSTGATWREQLDPRIPLSDLRLVGKVSVVSATPELIVVHSDFSLPTETSAERRVAQQMEFKILGAKYEKIDCMTHTLFDPRRKVNQEYSTRLQMQLEGRTAAGPAKIESTQRFHLWLLEHSVP